MQQRGASNGGMASPFRQASGQSMVFPGANRSHSPTGELSLGLLFWFGLTLIVRLRGIVPLF